jgi:hypothetical protein
MRVENHARCNLNRHCLTNLVVANINDAAGLLPAHKQREDSLRKTKQHCKHKRCNGMKTVEGYDYGVGAYF